MRFAVFTHVIHQQQADRFYAYSPYVREMNLWFKYVEEVEVVAPASQPPKGEFSAKDSYQHAHINFTKVPSFALLDFTSSVKAAFRMPIIIFKIAGAMKRADHLHLRCPGNIGLLAAITQIFFPKKLKTVKYAGNWDPEAKQPWTYKLQKKILSNTFLSRNINVLVYGDWPNQSGNILPFFTASFSEEEKELILKDFKPPYKFIFTGNLVKGKGLFEAIDLIKALNNNGLNSELEIYGDGILKDSLNDYIQRNGLQEFVKLKGRKSLEELKEVYKKAHFIVLLSKSEGWPKAVAEAMFFGCIPIATGVSCVPWMLGGGSRGILISDGNEVDEKLVESGHPPLRFGQGGQRSEENQDGLGKVDGGLLDTFQKNRQFECLPVSPEGERRNVSRTGFSETLEVTSGINNEWKDALKATVQKIIELINDPEEMKRMSREAQEWSQEYTLEKFEEAIKKLLVPQDARP